jgi:hypothetical protein
MADQRICLYISQRDHGDSPPGTPAEVVYETLISPAMERFPDFETIHADYTHEPGSISPRIFDEVLEADLVIADLTELSPSGYYQLGLRQAAQMPFVLIAETDYVMAVNGIDFHFVRYAFHRSPSTAGDMETIDRLSSAIRDALELKPQGSGQAHVPKKGTRREQRIELASRIEETAEIIRVLRVNSAADAVTELFAIAEELKTAADDDQTPSALKEAGKKALQVLIKIADQLRSVRGSRIAISGALALILGGSGWPAVTAFGVGLAFWDGKEAFLKAVEAIWRKQPKRKG